MTRAIMRARTADHYMALAAAAWDLSRVADELSTAVQAGRSTKAKLEKLRKVRLKMTIAGTAAAEEHQALIDEMGKQPC